MPELPRPATHEDAAAVAELCNALTQAHYGEADVDEAVVAGWFGMPDIAMFVVEADGGLAGYADVRRDDDGARFPIDVRVHPDRGSAETAGRLLDVTEAWSRERARPAAQLRAFAAERDERYRRALEQRGYELVRHSFVMEIALAAAIEPPAWPEGVAVRTFDPERDEVAVHECVEDAFSDNWDFHPVPLETWREFRVVDPRFDPELWWLAEEDGELAGVSLNAWHLSGDPRFGWIAMLGVRRRWRRRGLALALLRHSFRDFAGRGATRVGLGVDAENTTGAVRLYERAGMRPVRRADTYSRSL